jgi:hypothetical protein
MLSDYDDRVAFTKADGAGEESRSVICSRQALELGNGSDCFLFEMVYRFN